MIATGWCEDCGDVEVQPMCTLDLLAEPMPEALTSPTSPTPYCCHYADCPQCGNDVDQWSW